MCYYYICVFSVGSQLNIIANCDEASPIAHYSIYGPVIST